MLYAQNHTHMYEMSPITRKSVLIRISRFKHTTRIRTQKSFYAQNTYFLRRSSLELTSRMRTQKSVQPMQSRLQGGKAIHPTYADCYSCLKQVDKKRRILKKKLHNMRREGQVQKSQP